MKKLLFFIIIGIQTIAALYAQNNNASDYFLMPGNTFTLAPGAKLHLTAYFVNKDEVPVEAVDIVKWMVNGSATPDNTADGTLNVDLGQAGATYIAPAAPPEKNPVAVSVTIQIPDSKSQITLVCNITVLSAQYKITMDAENTIDQAGKDIKLHGECYANLKALDDGSFMLEPVDKTRNMNVSVEENKTVNANGATGEIVFPKQYVFPFLFSINTPDKNTGSGKATVYLNTTAPQTGIVKTVITADGKTVTTITNIDKGTLTTIAPGYAKTIQLVPEDKANLYAMDGATGLNLLSGLMTDPDVVIKNVNQNKASAEDKMALMKRIQAHQNNPSYFQTPQGKADLKAMQSQYSQVGGNIANASNYTQNSEADIAGKLKTKDGYAGSAQMNSDLNKTQLSADLDKQVYQKDAMAKVSPGTAMIRIEGAFNVKSGSAFTGSMEKEIGPMKTTLKITVEKN